MPEKIPQWGYVNAYIFLWSIKNPAMMLRDFDGVFPKYYFDTIIDFESIIFPSIINAYL